MLLNNRAYVFVRTITNKEVTHRLYLRIVFGKQKKDYSLGIKISDPAKFDSAKNQLKGGADALNTNILIQQMLNKANKILHDADIEGEKMTAEKFEILFKDKQENTESFISFANEEIKFMSGQITDGYHRLLKSEITKIKRFKPEISFSEINYEFLRKYERYMTVDLKNNMNTVGKTMKKLKMLLNIAVRK